MGFNEFQLIKRHFYALRNGMLGEQMRAAGTPYRIIFGLNLPQLKEVAAGIAERNPQPEQRRDLARRLRDNRTTRESMLLAPMIYPRELLSEEEALDWAADQLCEETADYLCFHLLRHLPCASLLCEKLISGEKAPLRQYTALRLMLNLLILGKVTPETAAAAAQKTVAADPESAPLRRLAKQIIAEALQED